MQSFGQLTVSKGYFCFRIDPRRQPTSEQQESQPQQSFTSDTSQTQLTRARPEVTRSPVRPRTQLTRGRTIQQQQNNDYQVK